MISIKYCTDYFLYWSLSFDPDLGDLTPFGIKAFFSHIDNNKPVYRNETPIEAARRNGVVLFLCNDGLLKTLPQRKIPKEWWVHRNHVKALDWVSANQAANYIESKFNFKELYT